MDLNLAIHNYFSLASVYCSAFMSDVHGVVSHHHSCCLLPDFSLYYCSFSDDYKLNINCHECEWGHLSFMSTCVDVRLRLQKYPLARWCFSASLLLLLLLGWRPLPCRSSWSAGWSQLKKVVLFYVIHFSNFHYGVSIDFLISFATSLNSFPLKFRSFIPFFVLSSIMSQYFHIWADEVGFHVFFQTGHILG